jgi:hypothetical protein
MRLLTLRCEVARIFTPPPPLFLFDVINDPFHSSRGRDVKKKKKKTEKKRNITRL